MYNEGKRSVQKKKKKGGGTLNRWRKVLVPPPPSHTGRDKAGSQRAAKGGNIFRRQNQRDLGSNPSSMFSVSNDLACTFAHL